MAKEIGMIWYSTICILFAIKNCLSFFRLSIPKPELLILREMKLSIFKWKNGLFKLIHITGQKI